MLEAVDDLLPGEQSHFVLAVRLTGNLRPQNHAVRTGLTCRGDQFSFLFIGKTRIPLSAGQIHVDIRNVAADLWKSLLPSRYGSTSRTGWHTATEKDAGKIFPVVFFCKPIELMQSSGVRLESTPLPPLNRQHGNVAYSTTERCLRITKAASERLDGRIQWKVFGFCALHDSL